MRHLLTFLAVTVAVTLAGCNVTGKPGALVSVPEEPAHSGPSEEPCLHWYPETHVCLPEGPDLTDEELDKLWDGVARILDQMIAGGGIGAPATNTYIPTGATD